MGGSVRIGRDNPAVTYIVTWLGLDGRRGDRRTGAARRTSTVLLHLSAVVVVLVVIMGGCFSPKSQESGAGGTRPRAEPSQSWRRAPDALEQMEVAFIGNPRQAEIQARLDRALNLYNTPISEENYSRAGSALVTLRREIGPSEMDILDYMIRSHVPGVNMSFPNAAGISAAALAARLP